LVSLIVAGITPHRVLLGRDDTVRNYYQRRDEIFSFLNGKMSKMEVQEFIQTYKVRYILQGIDAPPYASLPYDGYGVFTKKFSRNAITIYEVNHFEK
jgi:hypothetical protein